MPELYTNDIDALLAKLFAGEASPGEAAAVQDWRAESAQNEQYFRQLQRLWNSAGPQADPHPVDTEAALQKVKARLDAPPLRASRGGSSRIAWMFASAAAVAAVLIAVVFLFVPGPKPVEIAATDAVRTDTLKDGSVVALNRASSLTIAAGFGRAERRLRLRGEAHFAVSPDRKKPFVIEARQLEIWVVGTEFTVDDQRHPGKVVVTVTSGIVELRGAGQTERLQAGEEAEYDHATGRIQRAPRADPNADAWRSQRFNFESTPLGEVVEQFKQVYGVDIVLKNQDLANCPLNGQYEERTVERVLELVAETFTLTLTRDGERYVLDGPDCGAQ